MVPTIASKICYSYCWIALQILYLGSCLVIGAKITSLLQLDKYFILLLGHTIYVTLYLHFKPKGTVCINVFGIFIFGYKYRSSKCIFSSVSWEPSPTISSLCFCFLLVIREYHNATTANMAIISS